MARQIQTHRSGYAPEGRTDGSSWSSAADTPTGPRGCRAPMPGRARRGVAESDTDTRSPR